MSFNKAVGIFISAILAIMIISGIYLTFLYKPGTDSAFKSVNQIRNNFPDYAFFNLHHIGSSLLFVALYIHIIISIAQGRYVRDNTKHTKETGLLARHERENVQIVPDERITTPSNSVSQVYLWNAGLIVFLLLIITSFTGAVLPYNQNGGWSAVVAGNMLASIPLIGNALQSLLFGDGYLGGNSLFRLMIIHIAIASIIPLIVYFHVKSVKSAKTAYSNTHAKTNEIQKNNDGNQGIIKHYPPQKRMIYVLVILTMVISYIVFSFIISPGQSSIEKFSMSEMPEQPRSAWYLLPWYGVLKSVTIGINIYTLAGIIFCGIYQFISHLKPDIKILSLFIVLSGILLILIGVISSISGLFKGLILSDYYLISAGNFGMILLMGIFAILFMLPILNKNQFASNTKNQKFHLTQAIIITITLIMTGVSGYFPPSGIWPVFGAIGLGLFYFWFLIALPTIRLFPNTYKFR